jgi:F0F1-type ATP synthase membrane subunit b/b'
MKLKTMADEFLQRVLAQRNIAVEEAKQKEVQSIHEPFKAQMISARDKALSNEEQKFRDLVDKITKEHNDLVQSVKDDFANEIQKHKEQVERSAEAKARVEYDKFINGVCTVADEIKEN